MLKIDGNQYTYNHRSFQEYFAALFLTSIATSDKSVLYDRYLKRGAWDNALYLAFDMNQALIEKEFIIPRVAQLKAALGETPLDAMRSWFSGFEFQWVGEGDRGRPHHGVVDVTDLWEFLRFAERAYKGVLKDKAPRFGNLMTKTAFLSEFGPNQRVVVNLNSIADGELDMLDRLGIMKVTEKHIAYINLISNYLEQREKVFSSHPIDDWL